MPRRSKGPRLYLDPKRKQWVIRDGTQFIRTGCGAGERTGAEKFLARYIGQKFEPEPSSAPMIAAVLATYAKEVAAERKTASNLSYNIGSLLRWWGDKTTADISKDTCKAYAATKTAPAATQDLKILKAAIRYWHTSKYGPLQMMPTIWRPDDSPPRERYLSRSEAARLLWHARRYQHLRRFILLGLYTGSRPGVTLALTWAQVDFRSGVLSRLPAGATPDQRKRAPKVKLGRRILAHLKRWKRLDKDAEHICHFKDAWHPNARPVQDPHQTWKKVVRAAKLKGVTRHTLRHTRATWMMQRGVPIWEAAGFLGMTVKTLEKVYGHHDPAHQERAANI
jgi:integrase